MKNILNKISEKKEPKSEILKTKEIQKEKTIERIESGNLDFDKLLKVFKKNTPTRERIESQKVFEKSEVFNNDTKLIENNKESVFSQ